MTYSIVYDAIQIKMTRFEKPAPLINTNEVAAAMLLCYRQAKIEPPELKAGATIGEVRDAFFKSIEGKTEVNEKLLNAIRDYPEDDQPIDEAAKATYEFGLAQIS